MNYKLENINNIQQLIVRKIDILKLFRPVSNIDLKFGFDQENRTKI